MNFSSVPITLFFGTSVSTMEGWLYSMMGSMDFNGLGHAPQYNATEHIQIFYLVLYLAGGIIALNFLVSTVLINYGRIKE